MNQHIPKARYQIYTKTSLSHKYHRNTKRIHSHRELKHLKSKYIPQKTYTPPLKYVNSINTFSQNSKLQVVLQNPHSFHKVKPPSSILIISSTPTSKSQTPRSKSYTHYFTNSNTHTHHSDSVILIYSFIILKFQTPSSIPIVSQTSESKTYTQHFTNPQTHFVNSKRKTTNSKDISLSPTSNISNELRQ